MEARGVPIILTGYDESRNFTYRVFEPKTFKVTLSRDVVFDEREPFKSDNHEKQQQVNVIPIMSINELFRDSVTISKDEISCSLSDSISNTGDISFIRNYIGSNSNQD